MIDEIVVVPPAQESLTSEYAQDSSWPKEILNHCQRRTEARIRQNLYKNINSLFSKISDVTMDIASAIDRGIVTSEHAATVYTLLADFLEADSYHGRMILYLPFELLCDQSWQPQSELLVTALARFNHIYIDRWHNLFTENDLRANFVDGDVLEPELHPEPMPRVRKAAHLIPKLVEKGLICVSHVMDIMETTQDNVLAENVAETLFVLADLGLLPRAERKRMFLRFGHSAFAALHEQRKEIAPQNIACKDSREWLRGLAACAVREHAEIKKRHTSLPHLPTLKARADWERQDRADALITAYAKKCAEKLVCGLLTHEDMQEFFAPPWQHIHILIGIRAVGTAVETLAKSDRERARVMVHTYETFLRDLWQRNEPYTRSDLLCVWSRWIHLGVIDDTYLRQLGAHVPQLDARCFADIKDDVQGEIKEFAGVLQSFKSTPEFARFFYPLIIFFGSRIKGYAIGNADLDVAVFVRPGTPGDQRPRITELLSKIFLHEKIGGKVVQFWLAKKGEMLAVRNFSDPDVMLADSTWIHILFGSVWYGTKEAIRELYEKLLPEYLFSRGKKVAGYDARKIWLEEIERDVLQYRLMHKGYARYYPKQGGINTPHANLIDCKSMFWDSGYRRLATKLFLANVFLPQLDAKKIE